MSITKRISAWTVPSLLLGCLCSPFSVSAAGSLDHINAPSPYRLSKQLIAGGGARVANRRYVLTGSVGQSVAGTRGHSQYGLAQGFHHPLNGDAAAATSSSSNVETEPKG